MKLLPKTGGLLSAMLVAAAILSSGNRALSQHGAATAGTRPAGVPDRFAAHAPLTTRVNANSSSALVIAFVGGFVHADDMRHAEVQIAQDLQSTSGGDVQAEVFRNREREQAHKVILSWWGRREQAKLTSQEQNKAALILFGHSWGGSAVVSLARELQQDGIPVSLTIQVDSVRKLGHDDSIIPANVAEAMNFYQPDGIVHGRSQIKAADPSRTKILGNLRFKYQKLPAECHVYPWFDRLFFGSHIGIECDPRVWYQVETLIRNRLTPATNPSANSGAIQAP